MAVKIVRDEPLFKKAALNEIRVLKKCDGICPAYTFYLLCPFPVICQLCRCDCLIFIAVACPVESSLL